MNECVYVCMCVGEGDNDGKQSQYITHVCTSGTASLYFMLMLMKQYAYAPYGIKRYLKCCYVLEMVPV